MAGLFFNLESEHRTVTILTIHSHTRHVKYMK